MEKVKSLILQRYNVEIDPFGMLMFTKKETNERIIILPLDREVFISVADIPESEKKQENIPRLLEEGKGIMVKVWDLYKMFSGYDDEKLYVKFYGYDKRTASYLKTIEENIGLLKHEFNHTEEKIDILRQYNMFLNLTGNGMVNVGKVKDGAYKGKYIAQFSYRTDIDDYCVEKIYFNRLPTQHEVKTAILLNDIKLYFKLYPNCFQFDCWECGRQTHWLDIKVEDLSERFERLKQRYCGC